MWSGLSTLDKIDATLHSLRSEAVQVDQQLAQMTQRSALAEQRHMQIVREIARVRLADLDTDELEVDMSKADQEVKMILAQREDAFIALNQKIEQASVATQSQERARLEQLSKVNELSQRIGDTQADIQAQLLKDGAYIQQLKHATNAQNVAVQSKAKVDVAKANMAEKTIAYKSDALFIYLWDRGYGTTEYRAGLVARWLDAWVAKLISFGPARVNFWNLTQIPKRLERHAQNEAFKAEQAAQAVKKIELERIDAAGVNTFSLQLDKLTHELDRRDDDLEALESELNSLLEQRSKFIGGDDTFTQQCLSRLAVAMDHQDLDAVYRYVLETSSLSDDSLVIELSDLDQQKRSLKADLKDIQKLHTGLIGRLKDIESVRRNFKNARFDDVRSSFANQELLVTALGQFVQGLLSGSDLWGLIKRNQRSSNTQAKPGFGSEGLGRNRGKGQNGQVGGFPVGESSWQWPKPRAQKGGIRTPRGSSNSGGGFKTGGSF